MNDVFNLLAGWLADVLLLGSALLLLAHGAMGLIRQPAWRMPLAWGTLLGLLLLAILAACPLWPRQSLVLRGEAAVEQSSVLPPIIMASDVATPLPPRAINPDLLVASDRAAADLPVRTLPELPDGIPASFTEQAPQSRFVANLVRVWLGGAAIALGWIALGAWQAARLLRRSQESPEWSRQELALLVASKRRQPRLRVSERIATAVALGTRRPHILLPARSVQPDNLAGVRAALAHEWAHIRHGDLWLLALERLLLPLFFWHPLFWLLRRRVRFDQELLADAAAAGEQPLEYAEALLAWAKSAVASPARPPLGMAALSLWENPQSLTRRVEMILQAKRPLLPTASRPWRFLVTASLLSLVLGLSLVTLRPTATAQEDADRASKNDSPAKRKKQKKARAEARAAVDVESRIYADPATAEADRARTGETPIQMNLMVYELPDDELTIAKTDLGSFLQETSRECRAEDHLIIANYNGEQLEIMLQRLNKEPGVEVLSRPKVITLSDREAQIQIGSQGPLVQIAESVNGKVKSRVESITAGLELTIKPRLHPGGEVELAIVLEHSRLLPASKDAAAPKALPALQRRKVQLDAEVRLGETVVIAEQANTSKEQKRGPILLLAITPSQPVLSTQASPTTPAQQAFLQKEAQVRATAVEREGAQMQLTMQRGLEWLRKHQAGDQADEIERIAHPQAESTIKLLVQLLKQHDGEQLGDELERQAQALRLRRLELESASYRDGVEMLHRENDALRAQVTQLQQKLNDAQASLAWLRKAAGPEGEQQVNDETFLRRAYLDLSGALPPADKVRTFLEDQDAGKRTKLIDHLFAAELGEQAKAARQEEQEGQPDELSQRLHALDIREAEINLRAATTKFERSQALAKAGPVSQEELHAVAAEVEKAEVMLAQVKARGDRLKSQQLEVRLAESLVRAAQVNLERISALVASGSITSGELDAARFEVEKAEVALERARAKLAAVQAKETPRTK
jgi:beta-lactamase regulating signal transducer with metallopeptidase domain